MHGSERVRVAGAVVRLDGGVCELDDVFVTVVRGLLPLPMADCQFVASIRSPGAGSSASRWT